MKGFTIPLVPLIGLVTLGACAAEGASLTGTEIAHHGNGDGAPACTSCHGEHFQGEPTLKAPPLVGRPGLSSCLASRITRGLTVTTPSSGRLRQRSAPRSGRRWPTIFRAFRSPNDRSTDPTRASNDSSRRDRCALAAACLGRSGDEPCPGLSISFVKINGFYGSHREPDSTPRSSVTG
jgi:hypothetical protein